MQEQQNQNCSQNEYPIFNDEYDVLYQLGEGDTSKVFLCRHIKNPDVHVAIKILKRTYLDRNDESAKAVQQEIQVLYNLDHPNIIKMYGYGIDGVIVKPKGTKISKIVYIILEYIPKGLLFDLCQNVGGMGEISGRYMMDQLKDVLVYLSQKNVAHRDFKLENIMLAENLQLKIADFGFATYEKINKLKSYRGTKTYMAPEIKEHKTYDGQKADMFSVGVILFILVQGIFPFSEAKPDEFFYKLLIDGDYKTYWEKTGSQNLSTEFKDLIVKMLSYDPAQRPTVIELVNHPWMQKQIDYKMARNIINFALNDNQYENAPTQDDTDSNEKSEQKHSPQQKIESPPCI